MRDITKDIQIMINGSPEVFRLTKPDLFSSSSWREVWWTGRRELRICVEVE